MVTFSDGAYVASPPTTDFRTVAGIRRWHQLRLRGDRQYRLQGRNGHRQRAFLGLQRIVQDEPSRRIQFPDVLYRNGNPEFGDTKFSERDAVERAAARTAPERPSPPEATWPRTRAAGHPAGRLQGTPIRVYLAGPIGIIASDDPTGSGSYGVRMYKGTSQGSTGHGTISSTNAPGCSFPSNESHYVNDFQRLPPTDAWVTRRWTIRIIR